MGRDENVVIFKDTENLVRTYEKIKASVQASTDNQKIILENDELVVPSLERYEEDSKVVVSTKRTYEAAAAYKGMKTAVHNFASATNPGGGVVHGSSAQEECLCRCSGLYFSLNVQSMWNGFYSPHRNIHNPIHNDDIIYTPSVTVFKTDTDKPGLMDEKDWYDVDVITCAAPNLRDRPGNMYNQQKQIDTYLLIVPADKNGALENVIIDALKDIPEEKELIEEVIQFIDSLKVELVPELNQINKANKAAVGTFFSVRNPKNAMRSFGTSISKIDWSKSESLKDLFLPFIFYDRKNAHAKHQ